MTYTKNESATNNLAQTDKKYKFQVNKKISVIAAKKQLPKLLASNSSATLKNSLIILVRRFNYHDQLKSFWGDVEGSTQDLFDACMKGLTVKGGIKIGGNDKSNVASVDFIFQDFDNEIDKKLIDKPHSPKETTATKYGVFAAFWYASPSYTEENQKHRLGFRLDRTATPIEAEAIIKYLMDCFEEEGIQIDKSCTDPGRLYFGSARKDIGAMLDADIALPVDLLLAEARSKNENKYFNVANTKIQSSKMSSHNVTSPNSEKTEPKKETKSKKTDKKETQESSSGSITDKVLAYIYQEIFVNKLDSDVDKLYCLYDHKFNSGKVDQAEMIAKFQGYNPFSESDNSGSSFVVCCWDDQLPSFVDRSKSFSRYKDITGKYQSGGTFIDYFVFASKKIFGKYIEITEKSGIKGKLFKQIIKDICDYFDVDCFDFKQSQEVEFVDAAEAFMKEMEGKLSRFTGNGVITTFFCYSPKHKIWMDIINKHTFSADIIVPWIREFYGEDSPAAKNIKLPKFIWDYVCYYFPDSFASYLDKRENLNYIPMRNGLYDLANKKIIENDGRNFNRNISKYYYQEITEENVNVKIFKAWIKEWLKDETKIDLVINWFTLVCQRQAYKTGNMFGFIGDPKCGKSTAIDFLLELTQGFSKKPSIGNFTNVNNNHNTTDIENTQTLVFEEFTTKSRENHSFQFFKEITGKEGADRNHSITVNPKNEKPRLVDARLSVTFDCQDIPKGLNDEGFDRRAVYLMVTKENQSQLAAELNNQICNFEAYQDIFNWLVSRDFNVALNDFNRLKNHDIVKESSVKVRREELIPQFIIDNLEVTNDIEDAITTNEMYIAFDVFTKEAGENRMSRTRFSTEIKKALEGKSYGFGWTGEKKNVRSGGVVTKAFSGIKFTKSLDSFDDDEDTQVTT